MPTPDAPPYPDSPEKRSTAVVGAFLTGGNNEIFKTRKMVGLAVVDAGLDFIERPGVGFIRVIFVTLGRFAETPKIIDDGSIPLLEVIEDINKNIPFKCEAVIDSILIDSSTAINYFDPRGYAFLWPPISFDKNKRPVEPPRFLTPDQATKKLI